MHEPTTTAGLLLFGAVVATDWVDGWVARRTGQVSELGKVLDPTADRLATVGRIEWSGRRDLNPRPLVPQTSALPGCATSRDLHRIKGADTDISLLADVVRIRLVTFPTRLRPARPRPERQPDRDTVVVEGSPEAVLQVPLIARVGLARPAEDHERRRP